VRKEIRRWKRGNGKGKEYKRKKEDYKKLDEKKKRKGERENERRSGTSKDRGKSIEADK
jgi:hypothetical protein